MRRKRRVPLLKSCGTTVITALVVKTDGPRPVKRSMNKGYGPPTAAGGTQRVNALPDTLIVLPCPWIPE